MPMGPWISRVLVGIAVGVGQVAGLLVLQNLRDPTIGYRSNAPIVLFTAAYLVGPPLLGFLGAILVGGQATPKRLILGGALIANVILGILGHGLEEAGMSLQGYLTLNFIVMFIVASAAMFGRPDRPDRGAV